MDTQILKHGKPARLFPVLPDSQKEQKTLSIFLALMISVRPFAQKILSSLDVKYGKRSTLSCFTEVTLTNEIKDQKDRPDGLIVIKSGKQSWSALIEAKTGKASVEPEQLERYIQLAKLNGIDTVITITNQLTPSPEINPTKIRKALPKNISLLHISWTSIFTQAFLLAAEKQDPFENDDEAFMVSELIRYLEHPSSGVIALDQMNREWPEFVKSIQNGFPPKPKSDEITKMMQTWHQEARDVALLMTRRLKEPVTLCISRKHANDYTSWLEDDIKSFCKNHCLSFKLDVPYTAGGIIVEADFLRRTIRASMKVSAPKDKARNSSRLNWLLRQLKNSKLNEISILCDPKGRGINFGAMAHEIDTDTEEFKNLNEISSFTIEMSSDLSSKFNSRKKFIEELESLVPNFYANVGQHITPWVATPPKDKQGDLPKDDSNQKNFNAVNPLPDSQLINSENISSQDIEPSTTRPDWARQWSVAPDIDPSALSIDE